MLSSLRYFIEVARCGSIRIAAGNLNVAPSAVSRHIHNAEEYYGLPLFERHPRGVQLTSAGEIYLRYAKAALLDREQVRSEMSDLRGLRRGHVRIISIDGIVSGPLSDAIASFKRQHPGITFRLTSTATELVTKAVHDGEADIGIAYHATPDERVRITSRMIDPLHLVVAPDHPLAKRRKVAFTEALAYPLALPVSNFGIRKLIDAFCQSERIVLKPALETNSIEALRGFARSGAGVSMLHYLSISRDVRYGLVKAPLFTNAPLQQSWVEICVQQGRHLPPAIAAFTTHLQQAFPAVAR